MYRLRADLREEQERDPDSFHSSATYLVRTLQNYESRANLTDLQKEVLEYKIMKKSNINIAEIINEKYGKHYTDNYISTIFHQRILPAIADAAARHYEAVKNIFFPENFKKCRVCGKMLLVNDSNFVRNQKTADGFSHRCKECDKKKREARKA